MKRTHDQDMSEYTSFRAGGKADLLLIPEDEDELKEALSEAGPEFLILGNGSDTLFSDKGYHGTVIKLGEGFSDTCVEDAEGDDPEGEPSDVVRVKAGTAALLSAVASKARDAGLTGMELISGIPGSVGGAVYMNAGAYGSEIKDVLESVRALRLKDGEWRIEEIPAEDLDLSYRHSIFTGTNDVILSAVFRLEKGDKEEIAALMKEYADKRNSKQPLEFPSAGSFFKRPEGMFAGKLIEDAGLKGLSVGGAKVSDKHAGFIINTGDATATDIIDLMHLVQNTVMDKYGVMLEPEVRIIGE